MSKNIHEIEVELKGKEWTSSVDEAFNKKVFSFSEFEKYITVEESNIQIHEYPTLEYINNLPALNRA